MFLSTRTDYLQQVYILEKLEVAHKERVALMLSLILIKLTVMKQSSGNQTGLTNSDTSSTHKKKST